MDRAHLGGVLIAASGIDAIILLRRGIPDI
jgi:hypothetical protein